MNNTKYLQKMKFYALLGFIGGIFFMIGDCLIFCYKGYSNADIDPLWSEVAEWRFVLSAWLGFLGMALMLPAFYSYYKMIEETCGKILRVMATFMAVGVASTGFLHFALGSLLPITYKSILSSGGTEEIAVAVAEHWQSILAPLDVVLIAFLCLEYITHFAAVISGKIGLPRLMCLAGPLGAVLSGMIWKMIFKDTVMEGAWGACESLGEALVFLTAYVYWKKIATCKRVIDMVL